MIVGVGAGLKVPRATMLVGALYMSLAMYPGFEPETFTTTGSPTSAAWITYIGPVAPSTVLPPTSHWYRRMTGEGPQTPATAVSSSPAFGVPTIKGVGVVENSVSGGVSSD